MPSESGLGSVSNPLLCESGPRCLLRVRPAVCSSQARGLCGLGFWNWRRRPVPAPSPPPICQRGPLWTRLLPQLRDGYAVLSSHCLTCKRAPRLQVSSSLRVALPPPATSLAGGTDLRLRQEQAWGRCSLSKVRAVDQLDVLHRESQPSLCGVGVLKLTRRPPRGCGRAFLLRGLR